MESLENGLDDFQNRFNYDDDEENENDWNFKDLWN